MTQAQEKRIFSKKEAREYLGINRFQLDHLIEIGWIIPSRLGERTYRFTLEQLEACLEKGREAQKARLRQTATCDKFSLSFIYVVFQLYYRG